MTTGLQIVHAIPGRVRLKIGKVKDNPPLATEVQRQLSALALIRRVDVNPVTGSVLMLYDPASVASLDAAVLDQPQIQEAMATFMGLADSLGLTLEHLDTEALALWFQAHKDGAKPPASPQLAHALQAFLGTLNTEVSQSTNGWGDLRMLLPLTLFFLGVRNLLVAEELVFPSWYDYFWFAFGTFTALQPPAPARA